jgi:mutator protein MutT
LDPVKPRLRVVAAALFDAEGRVLIAERPAGKHMAGWWEFPGGKVGAGETDDEALMRELREELGVEAHLEGRVLRLSHEYPDRIVDLVLIRGLIKRGVPQSLDGQKLKWVHPDSMGGEKMLPADEPFIAALRGDIPAEVLEFLDRAQHLNSGDCLINVLDRAECARQTGLLRGIELFAQLGLVQLEDANNSNPWCFVTRGAAAGMAMYLSHDHGPSIKFVDLAGFEAFLAGIRARGGDIDESRDLPVPAHPDQSALARCIRDLIGRPLDDETEQLLFLYLPMLRVDDDGLFASLASSESFFVREAAADLAGDARIAGSRPVVERLLKDPHPQVREAARRALEGWRD